MKIVNIFGREFPYDSRYSKRVAVAVRSMEEENGKTINLDDAVSLTRSGDIYYYMGQGTFEYIQSIFPELKELDSPYSQDLNKRKRILATIQRYQKKIAVLKKEILTTKKG